MVDYSLPLMRTTFLREHRIESTTSNGNEKWSNKEVEVRRALGQPAITLPATLADTTSCSISRATVLIDDTFGVFRAKISDIAPRRALLVLSTYVAPANRDDSPVARVRRNQHRRVPAGGAPSLLRVDTQRASRPAFRSENCSSHHSEARNNQQRT